MTPASRPTITENDIPSQLGICSRYSTTNVAIAMSTELRLVPNPSDLSSWLIPAPSFVRTVYMPIIDRNTPTAAIIIGANTALSCSVSPPA